jgi:23S rRNA pseudouridine1911/1915/1917 synthase
LNQALESQTAETEPENTFVVDAYEVGQRLDAFLAERIEGWSRSRLQSLITNEDVLVNEKPAKSSYKLRHGDTVEVDLVEIAATAFEPENIPLDIVFEDEFLAVINKPARMVVYPGAGNETGTLANAMAHHFALGPSSLAPRLGIVHRLDKDTSGLIVVAKDERTAEELSRQFHDREVDKSYVALVHGHVEQTSGKIDRAIARDRWHRTKMTVAANGRHALSLWKVRKRYDKFTLVEVDIKTGRTHQIRVHLASINHPVVGDATYNEGRDNTIADINLRNAIRSLGRFFLHAEKLSFTHPKTGERMDFRQPLPAELQDFLAKI